MILYELRCTSGHSFEGWFRNSAVYDQQAFAGEIACPVCQDTGISKALMAPRIGRAAAAPKAASETAPSETSAAPATPNPPVPEPARATPAPPVQALLPQEIQAMQMLRTLRLAVEAHCENVGQNFAEEARKIHGGEAPVRGIYGETTPEKAEELAEEGIDFVQIPWLRTSDA